ncbi:MAG: ATP-binding protein [Bacillus sp. (in: firmicutes)]
MIMNDGQMIQYLKNVNSQIQKKWNAKLSEQEAFVPATTVNDLCLLIMEYLYTSLQSEHNPKGAHSHALGVEIIKTATEKGLDIKSFIQAIHLLKSEIFSQIDQNISDSYAYMHMKVEISQSLDLLISQTIPVYPLSTTGSKPDNMSDKHKERLTLLGKMTSSFVHEFRNPLTSIKGFIQLLKSEYPDLKYVDIVSSELEQLNNRISQFLMISRREEVEISLVTFQLDHLMEEVITFLYPSIVNTNVRIEINICDDIRIKGNMEEIRQVLLNIIFNALDVLIHTVNPIISIQGEHKSTGGIILTISNNGPMIGEDMQVEIFKPFTTTKKIGTGLGLFVCKEIIEKHKGSLTCHSTPEMTDFVIELPQA